MPYKDPERRRSYGRDWIARSADKARAAMQRWRAAHRELDRERKRARYRADPQRERARIADAIRRNPEGRRVLRQARRAREASADGRFTLRDWALLLEAWGHRCAYCAAEGVRLTADHRTPLSRGGSNAIENILPACRPCNARKSTSTEREFRVRFANERMPSPDFVVVDWWPAGEIQSVG